MTEQQFSKGNEIVHKIKSHEHYKYFAEKYKSKKNLVNSNITIEFGTPYQEKIYIDDVELIEAIFILMYQHSKSEIELLKEDFKKL